MRIPARILAMQRFCPFQEFLWVSEAVSFLAFGSRTDSFVIFDPSGQSASPLQQKIKFNAASGRFSSKGGRKKKKVFLAHRILPENLVACGPGGDDFCVTVESERERERRDQDDEDDEDEDNEDKDDEDDEDEDDGDDEDDEDDAPAIEQPAATVARRGPARSGPFKRFWLQHL